MRHCIPSIHHTVGESPKLGRGLRGPTAKVPTNDYNQGKFWRSYRIQEIENANLTPGFEKRKHQGDQLEDSWDTSRRLWVGWAGEEGADMKAFMGINLPEAPGNPL